MHNMNRLISLLTLPLFGLFLAPQVAISDPPPLVDSLRLTDTLPMDTTVLRGKLPNGFTYYIRHNEEPQDRVVMYLATQVGSILETDEERGLAHFLEHMQRSEEHTSELQSLMRISYAVFCLKKKK